MTLSYKGKLLAYFTAIFAVFTVLLVVFQQNHEARHRRQQLETQLQSYADIMSKTVNHIGLAAADSVALSKVARYFPQELRVTLITNEGVVRYESTPAEAAVMENHHNRPEIKMAQQRGEGSNIRHSETMGNDYFYFAKAYDGYTLRVALPYDVEVRDFMKADNLFLWFVLMLFPVILVALIQISDRFGKSVAGLRSFIASAERGLVDYRHIALPQSELGDIGRAIVNKYRQLEVSKQQTELERERLLRHFHYFEEGIAVFAPEGQHLYANPRFVQHVNTLLESPTADIDTIWLHPDFAPALEFVKEAAGRPRTTAEETPIYRTTLRAPGSSAYFAVQVLVYADGGFEMTLSDVTRAEKNRLLKQQMSNNITHELRTPVSSIRGYLETLLNCPGLSTERQTYFLERAHAQSIRLTDLIRDVALITKVEEAPETMPREDIKPRQMVDEITEELARQLADNGTTVHNDIPEAASLYGNYSLIHSIFRNLMENSLRYAGQGSEIRVNCYNEDREFCYFSYYDTGEGVPEEHLPRLFERFYRVTEGRTRDCGGTGLGLSIVRNAVQFHQGNISVRNRKDGGLEYLFTLKKQA